MHQGDEIVRTLRGGQFVLAMVGLIFSWVFFPPGMIPGFFPEVRAYSHANETLLGFCLVLFLAAAVARRPLEGLVERHRGAMLALVLSGLAGYGLLAAALAVGHYSLPFALVVTFVLSVSYVALMLCWIMTLARTETRQTMVLLFGSAIGYAALTMGNFLPAEGRMALCATSAALSGLCWFFLTPDRAAAPAYSHEAGALRHAPFALLGLLAVLLIGGRVVTGLYFNLDKEVPFGELLVRCACIAGVMAYCLVSARRGASLEQGYRNTWIPAAGLFLLGAMMIIGLQGPASYLGLGITHGALNCFEVLAYLIMFRFVKNDRVSPIMVVSLGMIVFKVLPIALQRLVFPQVISGLGLTEGDVVPAVILMSMVVLVSVLAFANHRLTAAELRALAQSDEEESANVGSASGVFAGAAIATAGGGVAAGTTSGAAAQPEAGMQGEAGGGAQGGADAGGIPAASAGGRPAPHAHPSFDEACAEVAREAGLSEREAEIMALIAHGNSQKHISEVLYLALGTVQWYAKAIYRKLGIHSKQELINLVTERVEGN